MSDKWIQYFNSIYTFFFTKGVFLLREYWGKFSEVIVYCHLLWHATTYCYFCLFNFPWNICFVSFQLTVLPSLGKCCWLLYSVPIWGLYTDDTQWGSAALSQLLWSQWGHSLASLVSQIAFNPSTMAWLWSLSLYIVNVFERFISINTVEIYLELIYCSEERIFLFNQSPDLATHMNMKLTYRGFLKKISRRLFKVLCSVLIGDHF